MHGDFFKGTMLRFNELEGGAAHTIFTRHLPVIWGKSTKILFLIAVGGAGVLQFFQVW